MLYYKKVKGMSGINFSILTLISYLSPPFIQAQTKMSFCDGDKVLTISSGDCEAGINFGRKKPDCVCITGVYRSWAEDCELFDGFISEFCSPLTDDNFNTEGIRLLPGVTDVYKDTAAVFGAESSDFHNWHAYLIGSEGKTKADSFYSLNGFPVMLSKGAERFICVEPTSVTDQQVCRFFATENKGVWSLDVENTIKVMGSCNPATEAALSGYTMAQLKENKCYDIMGKNVSECRLSCEGGPGAGITGGEGGGGSSSIPEDLRKPIPGEPLQPSSGGPQQPSASGSQQSPSSGGDDDMGGGSVTESSTDASNNANFFMHRKLNKYLRMRQVGMLPDPDFSMIAPNRTFSLLEIAKRVVRGACPSKFVSDIFIEQAMELFVMLHKGQDFRFIEDVEIRDFKWIEELLLTCRVASVELSLGLAADEYPAGCAHDGLIKESCPLVTDFRHCENISGGAHHQTGKYHYVIDAVWNIIDMTHALCYPYFLKSYRMFHVWEQASEKLFTRDIRNLWHKPNVDLRVYDALLSQKAMVDMINLERCTEAAYLHARIPRLLRPPKPKAHFRRKRAVESKLPTVAKTLDVYCAKKQPDFVYSC